MSQPPLDETIPTEYIRMDDRITGDLQYVNVRDRQVYAENYNILLARRARQPILTLDLTQNNDGGTTGPAAPLIYGLAVPDSDPRISGQAVIGVPIEVPPYTKTCTVNIYGTASGAAVDMFPVIILDGGVFQLDTSAKITISTGAAAKYSATAVPCIRNATNSTRWTGLFWLFCQSTMYGSSIKGGTGDPIIAVSQSADDPWIESSAATLSEGDAMVILDAAGTHQPQWEPRLVVGRTSSGGGVVRYLLDRPWRDLPVPGTDRIDGYNIGKALPTSLTVYCNAITDFSSGVSG